MSPREFVDAVYAAVYRTAIDGVIRLLTQPPGRRPRQEISDLSAWYSELSESEQDDVRKVVRLGRVSLVAWEPFVDGGDVDGGLVADGELVVAGGEGAVAFEPVDAAFDGVPLLVDLSVEGGRAAAVSASPLAVGDTITLLGDGGFDAAAAQPGAVGAGAVGLVGQDPARAGAGPARAQPGHSDLVQDGGELRAVTVLPGGDQDRQRFLALLHRQVDLGGQAAAGPAQAVIGGLITGRFGLQVPLFRAPAAC
jgi:hypothetical protein